SESALPTPYRPASFEYYGSIHATCLPGGSVAGAILPRLRPAQFQAATLLRPAARSVSISVSILDRLRCTPDPPLPRSLPKIPWARKANSRTLRPESPVWNVVPRYTPAGRSHSCSPAPRKEARTSNRPGTPATTSWQLFLNRASPASVDKAPRPIDPLRRSL